MTAAARVLLPALAPFRHAWPHLARQWRGLLIGVLCLLPANALELSIPLLWKRGVDGAVGRSLAWSSILELAGAALALGAVAGTFRYWMRRRLVGASRDFERDLRLALHAKLVTLPSRWFGRSTVGDLTSRMSQDVEAVRMALGPSVMYVADALLKVASAFVLMLSHDAWLTLWMGVPFLLLGLVALSMARRLGRASDAVQQGIARISSASTESFSGIRVLKLFTGEERQLARMSALSRHYFDAQMRLATARGGMMSLLLLVKDASQFVILLAGGLRVMGGRASLGDLVAYRDWMLQCFWPLVTFGWIISMVQRAAAGMRRIADVLDTVPEIASPSRPAPVATGRGPLEVELRGVVVRAHGRPVLDHVSLTVPAGSSLGLTGPSGSGKTTLVQLLARLLDPDEGQVLVGGVDVREWDLDRLRRAVGFVPQEAFLFSDLLSENLRFANPDADETLVLAAAHGAGLEPDLAAFPHGLETRVGERGVTLSGGQRQRATLARALLADPPVIVLDDALSAVDAETEARILARLRRELAGRTAIVVSHRVGALSGLDRIALLEAGRLVEIGSHEELLRRGGPYARLEREQRLHAELEAL